MSTPPPTLGERIAFHRKRRGLSQVELGRLIGRSESWVSQVERNTRKVDRLSVLAQVADILDVPVSELAPDAPTTDEPTQDRAPWSDALRLALTGHPALAALFESAREHAPTGGNNLSHSADEVWSLVHASRYSDAGPMLADLIVDLESAIRLASSSDRPVLSGVLASVYQATGALFAKVGDVEATWIASDRALFAAEHSASLDRVAAGQYRLAQTLLSAGRLDQARHAAVSGIAAIRSRVEESGAELVSVFGALHLVLAIVHARAGDRRGAWRAIAEAEGVAARLGTDRNDFNTEFGPTNVGLHAVAVAVELGDAGEALDRAGRIDPSPLSPERRARFLVDVARAHAQRRSRSEAVAVLLEAETIAPEQIRDHGRVRGLIRDLLQDQSRRSDQELHALAGRCGVPT